MSTTRTSTIPYKKKFWTELASGLERWEPVLMHNLGMVDPALLRALDLKLGQRVIDFGCGIGEPALTIAQWLGPRGAVIGVDIAGSMLEVARRRQRVLKLRNVRFRRGDLSRYRHRGPRFDRAVSRYGLMFARDVPRALENMRACLKRGGRLAVAVWGPIERNPTHTLRLEAVRPFLNAPVPDPENDPHPMRLSRPGLLPRLMRRSGLLGVRAEAVPVCWVFPSLDDYVRIQTETSLAETYLALGRADQRRLRERLRNKFRRFASGGVIRVPGEAWVASGQR